MRRYGISTDYGIQTEYQATREHEVECLRAEVVRLTEENRQLRRRNAHANGLCRCKTSESCESVEASIAACCPELVPDEYDGGRWIDDLA
jgi:hypothetical protein